MIRRNIETEARLVDDLLDLTRIARGKVQLHPEVLDAHAIVRHVIGDVRRRGRGQGPDGRAGAAGQDQSQVWADPGRFQQVLLNLVSNAVKFTPEDGTITIRTANENGTIKIEIADTGVGIEADVLPRLFQPFEQGERTVTRQFGGLGLGLSIVKSLVEMHKASISAASEGNGQGGDVHAPDGDGLAGAGPAGAGAGRRGGGGRGGGQHRARPRLSRPAGRGPRRHARRLEQAAWRASAAT